MLPIDLADALMGKGPNDPKRELALRIPAEPGWRAVQYELGEKPPEQGVVDIFVSVVPIVAWGAFAREATQGKPTAYSRIRPVGLSLGGGPGFMGFGGPAQLEPINADGRCINALRIVPPSVTTSQEQLQDEALAWLNTVNTLRAKQESGGA